MALDPALAKALAAAQIAAIEVGGPVARASLLRDVVDSLYREVKGGRGVPGEGDSAAVVLDSAVQHEQRAGAFEADDSTSMDPHQ